jgi:hypothetical protein
MILKWFTEYLQNLSLTPARSEALALFGQKGTFCKGLNKHLDILTYSIIFLFKLPALKKV